MVYYYVTYPLFDLRHGPTEIRMLIAAAIKKYLDDLQFQSFLFITKRIHILLYHIPVFVFQKHGATDISMFVAATN